MSKRARAPVEPAAQRPAQDASIVFYDARCAICRRSRRLLERLSGNPPLRFIDVNDDCEMARWPQVDQEEARSKVSVLTPNGRLRRGYDGVVELLAGRWKPARALRSLLETAPARWIGGAAYSLVSHNRYGIARLLNLEKEPPEEPGKAQGI